MSDKVNCAKLGKELPKIDESTAAGNRAGRMCLLIGGPEMKQRVFSSVSMEAWDLWADHMRMILNEYRLDPTADETNEALKPFMESFFFGEEKAIDNWVPPEEAESTS